MMLQIRIRQHASACVSIRRRLGETLLQDDVTDAVMHDTQHLGILDLNS